MPASSLVVLLQCKHIGGRDNNNLQGLDRKHGYVCGTRCLFLIRLSALCLALLSLVLYGHVAAASIVLRDATLLSLPVLAC